MTRQGDLGPGSRVGPYQLEAVLGLGGMGEVFRARDARLGRTVAIKLIRPEFATLEEFRQRFDREAKAISTLNHPNVCRLYDVGEHEGSAYLVMEYVEGETLAALMRKRTLPIDEVLQIGAHIADALGAAHARGIIHRDLKPGNIMVGASGVKVLDFGVAKHAPSAEPDAPTTLQTSPNTQPGLVLGTPAYMSPEQASGKPIDGRSDVFAAGVVLYEMLCGRRPFGGDTRLETLAAVLRATPEVPHKLRPETPHRLEQVIARCLEKQPSARFSSGSDLHRALVACQTSQSGRFTVPTRVAAAALIVVALGAAAFGWRSYQRAQRITWVEETAVPEIARLIQEDRGLAALKLFREAERYSPASKSLFRVAEGVASRPVAFETTPPGASIYISDYTAGAGDDLTQWESVGQSPLKVDQIPNWGYYRVRAVKAGFAPTDQIFGGAAPVSMTLQPEATVPPGTVWVPATKSAITDPALALPGFWMDQYEVTNAQFKQFVDAGGYQKSQYWKQPVVTDGRTLSWDEALTQFRDLTGRPGPATWQLGAFPQGAENLPVAGISWYEAAAYAEFAGRSLPTVHEWRHAAAVTFNSNMVQMSNFAAKGPVAVGERRGMSRFGSYDMAGNVKEWVDNASPDGKRYILGGAWDEPAYSFQVPDGREPLSRDSTFGFRTVKRVTPPPEPSFAPWSMAIVRPPGAPASDDVYRGFLALHAYEPSPLEARVERTDETSPYWRRETVSFRAPYADDRVIAHLFLPRSTRPPHQVVVVMGGSTITDALRRIEDFDYPFEFIVRSGRAVLIPAFSGTLERGPSPYALPANQERDRAIRWSMDLGRSLEYLETCTDIDIAKLGFYGVSAGASHGVRLLAVHPRFKAAVLSSGGLLRGQPPETDAWNFAPRVQTPILMVNGRYDFILPLETNQKPLFQALGIREPHKVHSLYEGGHRNLVTRPDLIGAALDWFDRYMGPVTPRQ